MSERKFLECAACQLERRGAKVRGVAHTCKTKKVDHKPEIRPSVDGMLYKIYYNTQLWKTDKATRYRLTNQIINGYQVKANTEIWVPDSVSAGIDSAGEKKWFWVKETFYQKLLFA